MTRLVERSYCCTSVMRRAAKDHRCDDCRRVIKKGEGYIFTKGFPGHDALSNIKAPIVMRECWHCAERHGRDYLFGAESPTPQGEP